MLFWAPNDVRERLRAAESKNLYCSRVLTAGMTPLVVFVHNSSTMMLNHMCAEKPLLLWHHRFGNFKERCIDHAGSKPGTASQLLKKSQTVLRTTRLGDSAKTGLGHCGLGRGVVGLTGSLKGATEHLLQFSSITLTIPLIRLDRKTSDVMIGSRIFGSASQACLSSTQAGAETPLDCNYPTETQRYIKTNML